MELNEALSAIIKNTLDDVDSGEVDEILKVLKDVGVKKLCHVRHVQESDLSEHLNKIQARMLIESFKSAADGNENNLMQKTYTVIEEAPPQLVQPHSSTVAVPMVECNDSIDISWHRLPKNTVDCLQKGESLRSSEFREMIKVIADDILRVNTNPQKKLVVKVAEMCVRQFPVLKDNFDCITLGTGHDNLAYRVYTRIENERRKLKPSTANKNDSDSPPPKKGKIQIDSYGCVAWSVNLPEGVTIEDLKSKKKILDELPYDTNMEEAITLLQDTYYLQREAINANFKIEDLVNDWPVLFTERGLEAHFKILTNIDLYKMLEQTVLSNGRKLLSYFRSNGQKAVKAFLAETDMDAAIPNELLLVVLALGKFFEEKTSVVFFTDEVFNPHDLKTFPKHPCLIGKGTSLFNCEQYMLIIDGVAVNTTFADPAVALASWFAAFYIFNVVYPHEIACTLEFFQRCLVGINPVSGSKSERKKGKKFHQGVHPKILTLLNKLNQFGSWVKDCRELWRKEK